MKYKQLRKTLCSINSGSVNEPERVAEGSCEHMAQDSEMILNWSHH